MKIASALEQAFCVLALLAEYQTEGRVLTNEELSKKMQVSPTYLKKITRKMVVGELIVASPGSGGGLFLARPMTRINLSDVVEAIHSDYTFFRSSGLLEKVFSSKPDEVRLGKNFIGEAFLNAEKRWKKELKRITMKDVVNKIKGQKR